MVEGRKRVFISYLNDDNSKIDGYFDVIEESTNYVKIETAGSIITIPYSRILKIKEKLK